MSQLDEEHALILSGGGANGAFEVGVLKALVGGRGRHLRHRPLDPQIISGTSVGAVNAALLASHSDFGDAVVELEDVWRKRIASTHSSCGNGVFRFRADPLPYADPRCLLRHPFRPLAELSADSMFLAGEFVKRVSVFAKSSLSLERRLIEFPDISNFIDTAPLQELLRSHVDLNAIRGSVRKIQIATTDWRRATPRVFGNGDLSSLRGLPIILGSTAIPGIFPPVPLGDELLVDGGVAMNTPLQPAIKAHDPSTKHLILHVIYLDPLIQNMQLPEVSNSLSTFSRLSTILLSSKIQQNVVDIGRVNLHIRLRKHLGDQIERPAPTGEENRTTPLAELDLAVRGRIYVTVHQYRPPAEVIGNILDLLDFSLDRVDRLIAAGERNVLEHDCAANNCELALADAGTN